MELQMVESQDGKKNILEREWFQSTVPFFFFFFYLPAKLSKHKTSTPGDMSMSQLTKGKVIVSESDCFASRI